MKAPHDACRFAENAYFIKVREPGQSERSITDIVREMASYADGKTMSAKKDPMANIGGWLALDDDRLAERCKTMLILTGGFTTYGGLAGRDLEAIAQGLDEVVQEDYLRYRIKSTAYLGDALADMFGRRPDGSEQPAAMDLVRLAIPRRTYTQSQLDYVVEVVGHVAEQASELRGFTITEQPEQLRHFTATFAQL